MGVETMIEKKREVPRRILQLQALLARLPADHEKIPEIKEQLAKRLAGYKGEKAIDYQLSDLLEKEIFILNDLRLKDSEKYFQIDSLILTRSSIILLEVKNIKGTIYFDTKFHQLIRSLEGIESAFQDPITQSLRHKEQMESWLKKNAFPDIPVNPLVVISNPNTLIRTAPNEINLLSNMVVNSHYLPTKIQEIHHSHKNPILNEKELKKLIRLIKKGHKDEQYSILGTLSLNECDILKGVICSKCLSLPMIRVYGSWHCPKCVNKDRDAHLKAMNEYFLLFGPKITNRKIRDFLCINSQALATRLLKSLASSSKGSTRDRAYYLSLKQK